MPSWELFAKQNQTYRERIIDPACTRRLIVEAGCSFGWERFAARHTAMITLDTFGASGPFNELAKMFGFTTENVLAKAKELLAK